MFRHTATQDNNEPGLEAKIDLFQFITSTLSAARSYISNNLASGNLQCLLLSGWLIQTSMMKKELVPSLYNPTKSHKEME